MVPGLSKEQWASLLNEVSFDTLQEMFAVESSYIELLQQQVRAGTARREALFAELEKRLDAAEALAKAKEIEDTPDVGEVGYEGQR